MSRSFSLASTLLILFFSFASVAADTQNECAKYSDHFDTYHPERWQEVLLYSPTPAEFAIEDGHLMLRSPKTEPCEVQVYSLFTFTGDFDIQVDYDLTNEANLSSCRFNAGLVLQTLGDEKSYKCYVAMTPGKGPFFRSRLDRFGEQNVAVYKGEQAPSTGTIKVVRKDNRIGFLALVDGQWHKIYDFEQACPEKLRVRFKLQTGGDEESGQTCPVQVYFDNFVVNSCDEIDEE